MWFGTQIPALGKFFKSRRFLTWRRRRDAAFAKVYRRKMRLLSNFITVATGVITVIVVFKSVVSILLLVAFMIIGL